MTLIFEVNQIVSHKLLKAKALEIEGALQKLVDKLNPGNLVECRF